MRKKELLKEIENLKKENAELKRENESLYHRVAVKSLLTDDLFKENCVAEEQIKKLSKQLDNLEEENAELRNNVVFNRIIHNKNATIVWFNNGKKIVVKRAKGEKGDVYTAVAYALAKSLFTTNTNFKKIVDEAM